MTNLVVKIQSITPLPSADQPRARATNGHRSWILQSGRYIMRGIYAAHLTDEDIGVSNFWRL